jgi:prephenate dehydrogenase
MEDRKITIVGCGLIGGSIAMALARRRPGWTVACLDLADRLPALREAGITAEVGTLEDMARHVPESHIVLLATPVQAILGTLELLGPHLRPGTVVTDAGSTKSRIMAEARALMPPGTHFVGGHPMAGSEHSGVEAADPLLFSDRVYVLCPYADTPPEALLSLLDLVESLMARPITIDPEEHDRVMAVVSHLPQLIAVALMHAADAEDATHTMLEALAGRGFLDMTRLAASEYGIWKGILETNREAIMDAIARFERSLSLLRDGMTAGNAALPWEKASRRRRKMSSESTTRIRKVDLRGVIDRHDKQILTSLGHRMQAARKMGRLKMNQAAPVHDPEREKRLLRQRGEWGSSLGLPQDLIDELFAVILTHSNRIQATEIPNGE